MYRCLCSHHSRMDVFSYCSSGRVSQMKSCLNKLPSHLAQPASWISVRWLASSYSRAVEFTKHPFCWSLMHTDNRKRSQGKVLRLLFYLYKVQRKDPRIHGHHNNDFHAGAGVGVFCRLMCTLRGIALVDLKPPERDSDWEATETPLLRCGRKK